MNNHIFPKIRHMPVTELKARHFIDQLKDIETKGLLEVASRTRQHLRNIMRHAVHQGMIESNPASNLEGIIAAPVKRHYSALPLEQLPELLSRIDGYHQGRELTRLSVSLTVHVFIRSSELRFARWTEISFRKYLDYPRHTRADPRSPLFRQGDENAHAAYCTAVTTGHRHTEFVRFIANRHAKPLANRFCDSTKRDRTFACGVEALTRLTVFNCKPEQVYRV